MSIAFLLSTSIAILAVWQWDKCYYKWRAAEEKCRILEKQIDTLVDRLDERITELEASVSASIEGDWGTVYFEEEEDNGPILIPEDLVESYVSCY